MNLPAVVDPNDEVLDYAQGQLKAYALHQVREGFEKIEDPKVFLATLQNLSGTAISRKRIKVEEQIADSAEGTAKVIAELLRNKAVTQMYEAEVPGTRSAPKLGEDFTNRNQNPGLTDINPPQLDIAGFMESTAHLVAVDDD